MLYKVLIKVINGQKLEWRYFCSVPVTVYHDFVNIVNPDKLGINAYLSLWARRDWGVKLSMGSIDDIERLKSIIRASNEKAYAELYVFKDYDLIPDEDFWVRLWVASHMRDEAEKVRAE